MTTRTATFSSLLLLLLIHPLRAEDDERVRDEQTLREANLAWDGASLLDYFRRRTPTESQRLNIDSLIEQLGHPSFRVREMATKRLVDYGFAAVGQLKLGRRSDNPEIASRCGKCLDTIETVPSGVLTAAVARMTGRVKPEGGLDVILAFLPLADDDTASDGLRWALARLAARGGKAEPALLKALSDPVAVRRGTAAEAIVRAGLKEHFSEVAKLRRDPDADVRLRIALILVTVAKDKSAVEDLVVMLETLPLHMGWQAEEVLHKIAGGDGPQVSLVGGPDARKNCRTAWVEWWAKRSTSVSLAKLEDGERIRGNTLTIGSENIDNGADRIVEYAPDGKTILWQITGLHWLTDAQILSRDQRVLLAERDSHVVTERDFRGKTHWKYDIRWPVSCGRVSNGNTFIAAHNQIVEVDRTGKILFKLPFPGQDKIVACRRSLEGEFVFVACSGHVVRVDANGKEVRSFLLRHGAQSPSIQLLPNNRLLLAGSDGVTEFDELTGRSVWRANTAVSSTSAQRLSNGNTFVCSESKSPSVKEYDSKGRLLTEQSFPQVVPLRVWRR